MKYHIHLDGEIQGPFTRAELEAKNLPPDTLCAAENDTAWDKLGEILQRPEPLPLYTEGTALGTLVGGVLAALWLGAAVFGGGLAKALLIVGCVGVLALGVLAIVRVMCFVYLGFLKKDDGDGVDDGGGGVGATAVRWHCEPPCKRR